MIQLTEGTNLYFKLKDFDDVHIFYDSFEARPNTTIEDVDDAINEDENDSVVKPPEEEDWKNKFKILVPEFEKTIVN